MDSKITKILIPHYPELYLSYRVPKSTLDALVELSPLIEHPNTYVSGWVRSHENRDRLATNRYQDFVLDCLDSKLRPIPSTTSFKVHVPLKAPLGVICTNLLIRSNFRTLSCIRAITYLTGVTLGSCRDYVVRVNEELEKAGIKAH